MREYTNLDHCVSVARKRGHDDVVVDENIAAKRADIRGLEGRAGQVLDREPVRPDIVVVRATTFAPLLGVHEGYKINEAVVVTRVRHIVRTIVIELPEIDSLVSLREGIP